MSRRPRPTSDFGSRLRRLRQERGWTQRELATHIGTTVRAINYYEKDSKDPPVTVVVDLATLFGVSVPSLIGRESLRSLPSDQDGPNLLADPEDRRLWKKFKRLKTLSDRDQQAVFRFLSALGDSKKDD